MKAVRLTSTAHAPRADHLPHCTLPPPRSQPIHLASARAAQSRAISRNLGRSRGRAAPSRAISERRSRGGTPAQKRKEVGGRRSRPIQSAIVAGFLAPGSPPDGCCAGQQTIGRRDDAPSGTLPPPPGYCHTSAATPTDFPSPHPRRNHRRDCRRCAPWRLCMSRVPARQGWCQGQINCQGWCQGQLNCLAGAKAQRLSSPSLLPLHSLNSLPLSPLRLSARSALSLPPSLPPSRAPPLLSSPPPPLSSLLLSPLLSSPLLILSPLLLSSLPPSPPAASSRPNR